MEKPPLSTGGKLHSSFNRRVPAELEWNQKLEDEIASGDVKRRA
jgi:hypothetical protein